MSKSEADVKKKESEAMLCIGLAILLQDQWVLQLNPEYTFIKNSVLYTLRVNTFDYNYFLKCFFF